MTQVLDKYDLKKISPENIHKWIEFNKNDLIGSAVFTKQNTWTSKLVQWGEKHLFAKCKTKDCFIPSHTGSIIEYNDNLYIFDMKPPKASIQPLYDFIIESDEDFKIVVRDFDLDTKMFSLNCLYHVDEFYPYLSALRSVFTKRQSKWRTHCSELHARMLDLCGYKFPEGFNFECTPLELFNILKG